ncbi:MAG: adenylosuccinate lyase [Acidobacteria bacterium]|nr:adenylosuccinate lyase [Acidobacteriota bacterium]
MIGRYTLPEMGRIWTDENRFRKWLDVEIAVCEAQAEAGEIPARAAQEIRKKASFSVDRILEIEKVTRHDVIAFVSCVAEQVGDAARYLHLGLTSSDVVDTAQALLLGEASRLILAEVDNLRKALKDLAYRYKDAPIVGRTHGIHAEPTTFGLKLALWYDEMGRNRRRLQQAAETVRVGKVSGPVGTFAHVSPAIEERVCEKLGLGPAPASSQIIQRDLIAEYMNALALLGASCEKFATEIRHLQRTEVREAEEPFARGQKGSSSMPHKRNPVNCEQICGLARLLRGYAAAALEDVPLWHERDISHSSVERVILPDGTTLAHYMTRQLRKILEGLVVYPERMRENLLSSGGLVFSGQLLVDLTRKGVPRDEAYTWVQRCAMRALDEKLDFQELIAGDPDISRVLSPDEIRTAFDLQHQLRHVDRIFQRVFRSESA